MYTVLYFDYALSKLAITQVIHAHDVEKHGFIIAVRHVTQAAEIEQLYTIASLAIMAYESQPATTGTGEPNE